MPHSPKRRDFRLLLLAGCALTASWLLTACDPNAVTFVVNSQVDAPDASPGDGVCETSTPGECTLRAAIMEANGHVGADVVDLGNGNGYSLSLLGTGEDASATGDLDVTDSVLVKGASTINGNGIDRAIDVRADALTLRNTTVRGGFSFAGGGIRLADGASLTLQFAEIRNNSAITGAGGISAGDAAVSIFGSAITQNIGGGTGGIVTTGPLRAVNSTLSGNSATAGTGAIRVGGATPARLDYVTVTDNSGSIGGINGPVELTASVVADQAAGDDCAVTATSRGYNADSDGSCLDGSATGDLPSAASIGLGPLAPNLVGTRNHLPLTSSPLIDAVPGGTVGCGTGPSAVDQRLALRPLDGDSDAVVGCDIGAIEAGDTSTLEVNHGGDARDRFPGDGLCQDADQFPVRCSLRAAVDEANALDGPNTISFATSVDTVALAIPHIFEDDNATGDLDIRDDLTIVGGGVTIDGSGLDRVVHVTNGASADLDLLTITGGKADQGGGVHIDAGAAATINHSSITANEATSFASCTHVVEDNTTGCSEDHGSGGGIWSSGQLRLENSTVSGNLSTGGQGCFSHFIQIGPFFRNLFTCQWSSGAGIATADAVIVNTTISENEVVEMGGGAGMFVHDGNDVTLTHVTITDNVSVPGIAFPEISTAHGIEIGPLAGTVHVEATSTSAPPTTEEPACYSQLDSLVSQGFNVATDDTCNLIQLTDLPETNPLLEPLADNGGPTRTQLPFADSPLVDAIPAGTPGLCDGSVPTDQRGEPRPAGPACDTGAVEGDNGVIAAPLSLIVNHVGDGTDATPGDGICQDASGADGDCSLRAAIDEANAWPAADRVTISPGIDPHLATAGTGEDENQTGDLDIVDDLTIDGDGATVDADQLDRVIHIRNVTADFTDLTITGGLVSGFSGGGGLNVTGEGADATLTNSTIIANTNTQGDGGGVFVAANASFSMHGSTIAGNTASQNGGGIAMGTTIAATVIDSTISGNRANIGGGISNASGDPVLIANTTISGNSATSSGGGVHGIGPTTTITNATIANNRALVAGAGLDNSTLPTGTVRASVIVNVGTDCNGPITSGGHNVVADATCNFMAPGDQQDTNPLLHTLSDNGGPTLTHLPSANSPVVDAVPLGTASLCDGSVPIDQRGVSRPVGTACDAGAVEGDSGIAVVPLTLVVDHSGDDVDRDPGDGLCQDASGVTGACSLRAAIDETNAWPTADQITIGAGIDPTLTRTGTGEDDNQTGDLDVTDQLLIEGGGATLDAGSVDRVLHLIGEALELSGLTVTGGSAADGGGIFIAGGDLTVSDSTITANHGSFGGGIHQNAGSLVVRRSSIVTNTAASGGGLFLTGGTGSVTNSTVSNNAAINEGGGILAWSGLISVHSSSLVENTANTGTAIARETASVVLAGSIMASTGADCSDPLTSEGYNISTDSSCGLTEPTDQPGTPPLVGSLADSGGSTPTHLPAANSPAVDAVPVGTAGLCDGTVTTDQRGQPRPFNGLCDIGAVERQAADP